MCYNVVKHVLGEKTRQKMHILGSECALWSGVCVWVIVCRQLAGRAPEIHQSWPASSSLWWDQMWAWPMVLWSCECDCPSYHVSIVECTFTAACLCVAQPWLWRTSRVLSDQSDRDWERGDGQGGGGERGVTQSEGGCICGGEHSEMGSGLFWFWHRFWSLLQNWSREWENTETGNGI